jgi:hypothetical protein
MNMNGLRLQRGRATLKQFAMALGTVGAGALPSSPCTATA